MAGRKEGNGFAWRVMGVAAVLMGAAILIYALHFPRISGDTDDWASFGSYLAGISAAVVGFATVLLLLENVRLLRAQVEVSQAHADLQQHFIEEQAKALREQALRRHFDDLERTIHRTLAEIDPLSARAARDSQNLRDVVGNDVNSRFPNTDEPYEARRRALRYRLINERQTYAARFKIAGLLQEIRARFDDPDVPAEVLAGWGAMVASQLSDAAATVLYYEAWLDPDGATARWIRDHALLRYFGRSILLQPDDAIDTIPLPSPPTHEVSGHSGG
jgi:hypothetical protein